MAGIYIHIPFCKSKCAYCNFFSLASQSKMNDYLDALKNEIVSRNQYLGNEMVETIYFGGGTPSLLSTDDIAEIIEIIHKIDETPTEQLGKPEPYTFGLGRIKNK